MPTKRDAQREQTRRAILEAGRRLIASQGYDRTRMGQIARDVGVAHGTVYYHFADKQALLLAVLGDFFGQLQGLLSAWAAETDTSTDANTRFTRALAGLLSDNRDLARILRNEAYNPDPRIHAAIQGAFGILRDQSERALRHGIELGSVRPLDVRIASLAHLGMLKEVVLGLLDAGEEPDLDHVMREVADLQNFGIRPRRT